MKANRKEGAWKTGRKESREEGREGENGGSEEVRGKVDKDRKNEERKESRQEGRKVENHW